MNDRLKFRVWYKDENRYRPQNEEGGLFVLSGDGSLWYHYHDPSISSPEYGKIQLCCKSDFVIEQCTGLSDANGRLVYEGDIIESIDKDGEPTRHVIEWNNDFVRFEAVLLPKHEWKEDGWIISTELFKFFRKRVVGNIHENPELLESSK